MPILYETYSFSPTEEKDTETTLTIELLCYTCPVCKQTCFPTEAALASHMKHFHPFQWYFWYAPYGKPLLGLSIGAPILLIAYAFAPRKKG